MLPADTKVYGITAKLAIAVNVLALVLILWPRTPVSDLSRPREPKSDPSPKDDRTPVVKDKAGLIPDPPNESIDYKAAMYVLSIGGKIREKDSYTDADLQMGTFRLKYVDLTNSSRLDDAGLEILARCTDLRHLQIDATDVTNVGLTFFNGITSLEYLGLGKTKVTDAGLAHFKSCRALTYLGLYETQIGDSGLSHFADCDKLQWLQLSLTQVSDASISQMMKWKGLKRIVLTGSKISPSGLIKLREAFPQCEIPPLPTGVLVEVKFNRAGAIFRIDAKVKITGEHGDPGRANGGKESQIIRCYDDEIREIVTLTVNNQQLENAGFRIHQTDLGKSRLISAMFYPADINGILGEGVDITDNEPAIRVIAYSADSGRWPNGGEWRLRYAYPK